MVGHHLLMTQEVMYFLQELARQLNSDVLSKFQDAGVKLFLISIGPPERGIKFHDLTGLPQEVILADPDNLTYDALGFKNDVFSAFFSWEVKSRDESVKDTHFQRNFTALTFARWRPKK